MREGEPVDAPNRSAEVANVVNAHLDLLKPPVDHPDSPEQGDARKRAVLPFIAQVLNALDGGWWGVLRKPGRDLYMNDILVWQPTLEHFDVLTDSGPTWAPKGPIQPGWTWEEAPKTWTQPGEPTPDEPDEPASVNYDEQFFIKDVGPLLAADYKAAGRKVGDDPLWVVWPARIQADHDAGMSYPESRAKHRQEWRDALPPIPQKAGKKGSKA